MKTALPNDSIEYQFRFDLRDRFRSLEEASVVLQIPLYRIQKACRGDLSCLTCGDWTKLQYVISTVVRYDIAQRYFGVR